MGRCQMWSSGSRSGPSYLLSSCTGQRGLSLSPRNARRTLERTVGAGEAEAKARSELGWFCTATTYSLVSVSFSSAHHSLFRSYLYSLFRSPLSTPLDMLSTTPYSFFFSKPNKFSFGKLYASGVPRRASCPGDAHAPFCAPARRSCSSISLQTLYQPQCNADNGTSHVASHG